MQSKTLESKALEQRSDHYPERFEGKVPKRVEMLKTVRPDLGIGWEQRIPIALKGNQYWVHVNSHGAVTALIGEESIGLKPDEFEVVEFHKDTEMNTKEASNIISTMPQYAQKSLYEALKQKFDPSTPKKDLELVYSHFSDLLYRTNQGHVTNSSFEGNRKIDLLFDTYSCSSRARQAIAIAKCMMVADYVNGEKHWRPNANNSYAVLYVSHDDSLGALRCTKDDPYETFLYFKSRGFAINAIEILGEETIRRALGL